jgi:hypothetical protein
MSAQADILRTRGLEHVQARPIVGPRVRQVQIAHGWSPSTFAKEQICGLVRQVFFSSGAHPVRQVVLTGAGAGVDLTTTICELVGRELALEARASVAVVGTDPAAEESGRDPGAETNVRPPGHWSGKTLRQGSIQAANNLWLVPDMRSVDGSEECAPGTPWQAQMADLRREFEYSIVNAPCAGTSSDPGLMGQLADGVILVLEAHHTRRAIARKIIETFEAAQVRMLGIVLSERTFPLPEWIYRRL